MVRTKKKTTNITPNDVKAYNYLVFISYKTSYFYKTQSPSNITLKGDCKNYRIET